MRFRAFSHVARGYTLALLFGLSLAVSGVEELPALLAFWLGGAVLTLGLAALASRTERAELPVRVAKSDLSDLRRRPLKH